MIDDRLMSILFFIGRTEPREHIEFWASIMQFGQSSMKNIVWESESIGARSKDRLGVNSTRNLPDCTVESIELLIQLIARDDVQPPNDEALLLRGAFKSFEQISTEKYKIVSIKRPSDVSNYTNG